MNRAAHNMTNRFARTWLSAAALAVAFALLGPAAADESCWDGAIGQPGMDSVVNGFTIFDVGSGAGPALYAGGAFAASPAGDSYLAKWQGCPTDPGIPGDLTGDGSVGVADLLILIGAWGACDDCADCPADLTNDCTVGVADLLILINNWG